MGVVEKILFIALFICSVIGCSTDCALHESLSKAGDNRLELEKVLSYFQQHPSDTLKYKAARFLIENMPGHISRSYICPKAINAQPWYFRLLADLAMDSHPDFCIDDGTEYEDVTTLSSDFLIKHIESAFAQREKYEWLKNVSFSDFCEYLLPYRVGNEEVFLWRDSLVQEIEVLRSLEMFDDLRSSVNFVSRNVPMLFISRFIMKMVS